MKADHQRFYCASLVLKAVWVLPLLLTGCLDGDAQLQQELRDLRVEAQQAKAKQEELQGELAEARERIKQTESQPTAKQAMESGDEAGKAALRKASVVADSSPTTQTEKPMTAVDLRELAKELQADLMGKVNALSDQVQEKIPSAELQEVTVKRIHPPAEVASAFSSAITFTFLNSSRQALPVRFPVQAGFDGVWRVPTVEDVQSGFNQIASGEALVAGGAGNATGGQAVAASSVAPNPTGVAPSSNPVSGGRPTFDKQADGSIVINWDANAPAIPAPATAPVSAGVAPAVPVTAPTVAPAQSQSVAPAAAQTPRVPAPVMPVQQDIIVRFD
jgi:hypothetical protein